MEKAKEATRRKGDREIGDRQAGRRDGTARKEKPVLIVGRTSSLSRGYTMNTRGDGKAFRDSDEEGERSVMCVREGARGRRRKRRADPRDVVRGGM